MKKLVLHPLLISALLISAPGLLLSACGQNGPLYLPGAEHADPTAQSAAAQSTN